MVPAYIHLPGNVTDDQVKVILELFPKLTTVLKKSASHLFFHSFFFFFFPFFSSTLFSSLLVSPAFLPPLFFLALSSSPFSLFSLSLLFFSSHPFSCFTSLLFLCCSLLLLSCFSSFSSPLNLLHLSSALLPFSFILLFLRLQYPRKISSLRLVGESCGSIRSRSISR